LKASSAGVGRNVDRHTWGCNVYTAAQLVRRRVADAQTIRARREPFTLVARSFEPALQEIRGSQHVFSPCPPPMPRSPSLQHLVYDIDLFGPE
jgi:hypothetical protein